MASDGLWIRPRPNVRVGSEAEVSPLNCYVGSPPTADIDRHDGDVCFVPIVLKNSKI
jgi:hypothetical protein